MFILTALSLLMTMVVLRMHYTDYSHTMSPTCHYIVFNILAKVLLVNIDSQVSKIPMRNENNEKHDTIQNESYQPTEDEISESPQPIEKSGEPVTEATEEALKQIKVEVADTSSQKVRTDMYLTAILNVLKERRKRQEKVTHCTLQACVWRCAAEVLDRLFLSFALCIFLAKVIFLFVVMKTM